MPENFDDMDDPAVPACSVRYSDLTTEQKSTDLQHLMKQTMVHVCSGFCMREKNGKRVCKAGCGTEKTKFKCDTPGFPLRETAEVKYDHKRSLKLYMPRNHARINQTSSHMLQSWRANCDVQLLIYSGDPACPDLNEISRVTDYVVAYSCKGNITWKEEKEQTKQLVKAAEEFSGDKSDIARVAKKVMNRAASKRIISRQECMLLLSDLPLVQCTETIESVSINNSKCISNGSKTDTRLVTCYAKRPTHWESMSLKDYFLTIKNAEWHPGCDRKYIVPSFCGFSGQPCFPVTEAYARHTLIVNRPWRCYPTKLNWISEFNKFINSTDCPQSCKLAYNRVLQRFYHNLTHHEPKNKEVDHSKNKMSEEDNEMALLAGLSAPAMEEDDFETMLLKRMDKGLEYKWDKPPQVSERLLQ